MNRLKAIARYMLDKSYPFIHKRTLHNHRNAIAQRLFSELGGTVKYGPFKGLILASESGDVSPDFPSMIFGTYEEELLDVLVKIPAKYENFVNLGAGDGYYPIGAIKSGYFKNSIAFEENESRRSQMKRLAEKNNCQNALEIRGYADQTCFEQFTPEFLAKSVILSDIEGGEFEIFNDCNLAKLCNSVLLIEIHDFLVHDGGIKLKNLISTASAYFDVTKLTTTQRNPSMFMELESYTDIDRWFTVIEGRGPLMIWLLLNPKLTPNTNA